MNNVPVSATDGQAPARRFGACLAVVIILFVCACLLGVWYLFAREGIQSLVDSISLQSKGVTTTGTVTSVEEFSNGDPSFPSSTYKLTVIFEVAGEAYSVTSNTTYHPIGKSWIGETMPIIYDPEDPNTALINTFRERWFDPITNSAP